VAFGIGLADGTGEAVKAQQLERGLALLDWIHSELDLIEADLSSSSTPPQAIAANSSDC
jgi:hypothetical protein